MFVFAYHWERMYVPVFSCVSGEEPQPGPDLERGSLRLQLLLVEHKGKDEVNTPKRGRMLLGPGVRDLYAARPGAVPSYLLAARAVPATPLASQPQVCPSAHALAHSVIHLLTHSLTHVPSLSPTSSFIQSFTQLRIHSFTLIHTFVCTRIQYGGVSDRVPP